VSSKTVLIVDDEADIREVARASLEIVAGWDVLTAASGPEALAIGSEKRPDAILLDVMMPGMDGIDTFQKLREDDSTRNIPVLFLTAKVQLSDRRRFAKLEVAGYIPKPFDPMRLGKTVADLLGWPG